jgi:hypothetical protein
MILSVSGTISIRASERTADTSWFTEYAGAFPCSTIQGAWFRLHDGDCGTLDGCGWIVELDLSVPNPAR